MKIECLKRTSLKRKNTTGNYNYEKAVLKRKNGRTTENDNSENDISPQKNKSRKGDSEKEN